jgi:hypothetical protein
MQGNPLQRELVCNNRQTSGNWPEFGAHRQRLRELIESHSPVSARSISILGAGNVNDLDLSWLTDRYERVVLVDLDADAMRQGVDRQLEARRRAKLHLACFDVTGVFERLAALADRAGELQVIQESLLKRPTESPLSERFDCVVSTCLLSQLIGAVKSSLGESHPQFVDLVLAIRAQHLALVGQMTATGGLAMVAFDFVSSLTCPDLDQIKDADLAAYAAAQAARQNFFTGLNPRLVANACQAEWKDRCSQTMLTPPWKWNLGPRDYLVAAVLGEFSKAA